MSTPEKNLQNPYAPPTAPVLDLNDATGPREPASRSSRLGAVSVDGIVGVALYLPPLIVAALHWDPGVPIFQNFFNGGLAISAVLSIAWLVVTIILVARNGQTIGKRALGIKVVRSNGEKASLGRIFWLRNVVNGVLGSVFGGVLGGVVGYLGAVGVASLLLGYLYPLVDSLMIFGESHQCLHDRIADTIVIRA